MKAFAFFWHVMKNPWCKAHHDSMKVFARTEHEAIETAFDRIENEFDYPVIYVDGYDVICLDE